MRRRAPSHRLRSVSIAACASSRFASKLVARASASSVSMLRTASMVAAAIASLCSLGMLASWRMPGSVTSTPPSSVNSSAMTACRSPALLTMGVPRMDATRSRSADASSADGTVLAMAPSCWLLLVVSFNGRRARSIDMFRCAVGSVGEGKGC
eukprot:1060443-Prymnesium_polylepis.1